MQTHTLFVPVRQTELVVGTFQQWPLLERSEEKLEAYVQRFELQEGLYKKFFGPPGTDRSFKIVKIDEVNIDGECFKKILVECKGTSVEQPFLIF